MSAWCDCGHRVDVHRRPHTPGGERGPCLHCRCQGVVQTIKWAEPEEDEK